MRASTLPEPIVPSPPRGDDGAEWPQWTNELRAAGVSNRALASMVIADFQRRWDDHMTDLQHKLESGEIDANTMARLQGHHERERDNELRQALGTAGFLAWQKETLLHEFKVARVPMNEMESDRVCELRKTLQENRRDIEEAHLRGEIDEAALGDQVAGLESEYQDKLKATLGDDRYADMNSANDGVEADLRRQLNRAKLPAAQFDALADAERARLKMLSDLEHQEGGDLSGQSNLAGRQAINEARDQAYERILGPAGFAEWQKSGDPRFQTMQRYAPAWKLSEADIASVYASIQQQERYARDYQLQALAAEKQGRPTDWSVVQRRIDERSRQTEQSLRATLGDERVDRLTRNGVLVFNP